MKILQYDAFRADMQTRFKIDGGKIILEDINLQSAGASTDGHRLRRHHELARRWSTT